MARPRCLPTTPASKPRICPHTCRDQPPSWEVHSYFIRAWGKSLRQSTYQRQRTHASKLPQLRGISGIVKSTSTRPRVHGFGLWQQAGYKYMIGRSVVRVSMCDCQISSYVTSWLLFSPRNDENVGYILANILLQIARWYAKSSQSDWRYSLHWKSFILGFKSPQTICIYEPFLHLITGVILSQQRSESILVSIYHAYQVLLSPSKNTIHNSAFTTDHVVICRFIIWIMTGRLGLICPSRNWNGLSRSTSMIGVIVSREVVIQRFRDGSVVMVIGYCRLSPTYSAPSMRSAKMGEFQLGKWKKDTQTDEAMKGSSAPLRPFKYIQGGTILFFGFHMITRPQSCLLIYDWIVLS